MDSRGKVSQNLAKCYMHLDECRRALAELESALLAASAKTVSKKRSSPLQRLGVRQKAVREPSRYDAPLEEQQKKKEVVYENLQRLGVRRRAPQESKVSLYDVPPEEEEEKEEVQEEEEKEEEEDETQKQLGETRKQLDNLNLSFSEKRRVIAEILSKKKK